MPLRTVATSELVVPRSMPTASRRSCGQRRRIGFGDLQQRHRFRFPGPGRTRPGAPFQGISRRGPPPSRRCRHRAWPGTAARAPACGPRSKSPSPSRSSCEPRLDRRGLAARTVAASASSAGPSPAPTAWSAASRRSSWRSRNSNGSAVSVPAIASTPCNCSRYSARPTRSFSVRYASFTRADDWSESRRCWSSAAGVAIGMHVATAARGTRGRARRHRSDSARAVRTARSDCGRSRSSGRRVAPSAHAGGASSGGRDGPRARPDGGSDVEALAAAAGVLDVRVVEAEAFVQPLAREVELGAVEVGQALGVDDRR